MIHPSPVRFALAAALASLVACLPAVSPGGVSPAIARADSLARDAIRNERSIDPNTFPERSVGVAPLTVVSSDTALLALGWGLADLLTTDLSRSRELQVVERVQMDALLRELGMATTAQVDSSRAPRLGRLVGARRLVTGTVAQLPGDRIEMSTRIAEVMEGRVTGSGSATMELDRILDAEKELAFVVLDRLGVTLTPAERAAIEERPTRNIAALLAYSRGVREEARGDFGAAAEQYRDAVRIDPAFGQAQSRLQGAEQSMAEALPAPPAASAGQDQLRRAMELAAEPLAVTGLPIKSDAADPGFNANTRQLITLIIRVTIP